MPSSIVGETFARLRHASTGAEASAIVQQLIAERTAAPGGGGAHCGGPPLNHHRTTTGPTEEDLSDTAVHHMTQPQWTGSVRDALEDGHLDRLVAYYEAATWEQAAAIITGLLDASDAASVGHMHHSGVGPLSRAIATDTMRQHAEALHNRGTVLQALYYMMWHLPDVWATISPQDWVATGQLATRFEACIRSAAPSPAVGTSSTATAAADDAMVLSIARRWNRNVHFRRYGTFHVADAGRFADATLTDPLEPPGANTALGQCAAHLRRILNGGNTLLRAAQRQMLAECGKSWSSVPWDTLRSHAERVVLARLLSVEARLDNDAPYVGWVRDVLRVPGYDAVHELLATAIGLCPPTAALFAQNDVLCMAAHTAESSLHKQRTSMAPAAVAPLRAAWVDTVAAVVASRGETFAPVVLPPGYEAAVYRYSVGMEWVKEKKVCSVPRTRIDPQGCGEPGGSCVAADVVFLYAVFRWLWRDPTMTEADSGGTNEDHEASCIACCAPLFAACNTTAAQQAFVAAFLKAIEDESTPAEGAAPSAHPLYDLASVLAPVVHATMWWNTQPDVALLLLRELLHCSSDAPSDGVDVFATRCGKRCGRWMVQRYACDDNEGNAVDGAIPTWVASFLADPLSTP